MLPLGVDAHIKARAWFCDGTMTPVMDPCAHLRAIEPNTPAEVSKALGIGPKLPLPSVPKGQAVGTPRAEVAAPSPEALVGSPLREHPRALAIYQGCNVLRHFVDQAAAGKGLVNSERYAVAEILGRIGDEAVPALDAVYRHLDDYRPGMGARFADKMFPNPTSCYRFRERMPELTARVGCDCRFRTPPGAYATPVLHALGAAEVPGLSDRVRAAAAKGGLAKAALASMNEGRKEMGAKAAALCQRVADLKRQTRVLEKTLAGVEKELDDLLEEAGEEPLETPSGTLRKVTVDGVRRFVIEV